VFGRRSFTSFFPFKLEIEPKGGVPSFAMVLVIFEINHYLRPALMVSGSGANPASNV
jgi:hypothetical protein